MSNENHNPVSPPATTLDGLSQLIAANQINAVPNDQKSSTRKIPPLETWQPKFCGDMDLTIKANGEWWHEGQKMTRQSMVDLFASVLWAETDEQGNPMYFLKTPVEKLKIQVEDAPLLITQVETLEKDGKPCLEFSTPHGDKVIADNDHPITLQLPCHGVDNTTAPQPYILVRQNGDSKLYGLIHRNVFYHLIKMGELDEVTDDKGQSHTQLTLQSAGQTFMLSVPTLETV